MTTRSNFEENLKPAIFTFTPETNALLEENGLSGVNTLNLAGGIPHENCHDMLHHVSFNTEGEPCFSTITNAAGFYHSEVDIWVGEQRVISQLIEVHTQGRGIGTNLLINQVTEARKLGFTEIHLYAARSDEYNGYYTWGRLGFTMRLQQSKDEFTTLMHDNKRPEKTLKDLLSTAEGRNFWKQPDIGFPWEGIFIVDSKSDNSQLLNKYLLSKGSHLRSVHGGKF